MNQAAAESVTDEEDEDSDGEHVEFGGEGFDLDAHIAKLIANASKQDVGSLRAAGKPVRTIKRKDKDLRESHPRFFKIDESDEELEEDERRGDQFEEDELEEEDDEDGEQESEHRTRRSMNPMDNAFQRVLMAEYADENIGELDPDDPRVRGTGLRASVLERAMDEFMEMGLSDSDDEGLLEGARAKARRRKQSGKLPSKAASNQGSDDEHEVSDDGDEDDEEHDHDSEEEEEEEEVLQVLRMWLLVVS
jgi:hypothetical protein